MTSAHGAAQSHADATPKAAANATASDDQLDALFSPPANQQAELMDTLKKLVALARERHPAIKNAAAKVDLAKTRVDAANAAFWPTIAATGSLSHSDARGDGGTHSDGDAQELQLRLTQNIFRGGNDARQAKDAQLALEIEDVASLVAQEKLRVDVMRAALDYNDAAMRQAIERESLAEATSLRNIAVRKQGAGLVGKIDIDSAHVQEMESQTELKRLDTELAAKKMALAATLKDEGKDDPTLTQGLQRLSRISFPLPSAPPVEAQDELSQYRSQRQAKEVAKADNAIAMARSDRWLPSINIFAGVASGRQESHVNVSGLGNAVAETNVYHPRSELGMELTWSLFAPKASTHIDEQVATKTQVETQQAEENFTSLTARQQLAQQIKDLYALREDYRQLYQLAKDVHAAQRNLYQAGAADINTVINANLTRLSSLKNLQKLHYEINTAILNWQQNQL